MSEEKITQKEVDLWIGHTPDEWIGDFMYRLFNGKVSLEDARTEAKLMYKGHMYYTKEGGYVDGKDE